MKRAHGSVSVFTIFSRLCPSVFICGKPLCLAAQRNFFYRRSLAIALSLLALCSFLSAQAAAATDHTTYVVALPGADRDTLQRVEAVGGVLDHFDGHEARAYILHAQWQSFLNAGIPHRVIEMQPNAMKQLGGYPSYAEIGEILAAAESDYPEIVRRISLGQSVEGRDLWAVLITDQPDVEEDEPEFAYISTMHGDETVGTVLCLNFLEVLLDGYGTDPDITSYVDNTAIWLMPLMNPDGYEIGIRWNANNVDLNRAFPEFPDHFVGTIVSEGEPDLSDFEPEVAHVAQWSADNRFVLMANYHSGSLVVNYPYDEIPGIPSGTEAIAPDDALLQELSSAYANENPPMLASPTFPGGITNGSAWYSVSGGMQDWHYRFMGAIDLTLEVSNIKSPGTGALSSLWEDNRAAMFAYLDWVQRGVRGIVTDRVTGEPLLASVLVNNNPQPVFTDPDVGDYHRVLAPGRHTVRVSAPGFIPYNSSPASVTSGAALRVDVALSNGDVNRDGAINALDVQLGINALLDIAPLEDADVDGGGVSSTDVQQVVNRALGRH